MYIPTVAAGWCQAKGIHTYKNIKRKLYRTIAAIWNNKNCRDKKLTSNYVAIKINNKKPL